MLCLKLLVVQEGSRQWRSVHSCCFEPKTRALRRKARTVRQKSIIKLHEEMENGETFRRPRRFDKRPTTQCEENGENGCSQPPRTSTIKPCELARPTSDIQLHDKIENGDEFRRPRGLTGDPPHNVKKTASICACSLP